MSEKVQIVEEITDNLEYVALDSLRVDRCEIISRDNWYTEEEFARFKTYMPYPGDLRDNNYLWVRLELESECGPGGTGWYPARYD